MITPLSSTPAARQLLVSMQLIRRYAGSIVEKFRPKKILLFGSYAYGQPTSDSDVDLLVVMPARNQLDQAAKIRLALRAPFAMDLIVRTPEQMADRLTRGDSFTKEVVSNGIMLYEEIDGGVGQEGGGRSSHRPKKREK